MATLLEFKANKKTKQRLAKTKRPKRFKRKLYLVKSQADVICISTRRVA